MKIAVCLGLVLYVGAICGCAETPSASPPTSPVAIEAQPSLTSQDLSAPPTAEPTGPVSEEHFQRWLDRAELLILLETQRAQERFLKDWLALADENEHKFLERFGLEPLHSGEAAALELRSFQLVRARVSQTLKQCRQRQQRIELVLAKIDHPAGDDANRGDAKVKSIAESAPSSAFNHSQDTPIMILDSFSSFGVTTQEIERLREVGIRTPTECLEHFLAPEQHALLAGLLGREHQSAVDLINAMAKRLTAAEIQQLRDQTFVSRSLGVLPPETGSSSRKNPGSGNP